MYLDHFALSDYPFIQSAKDELFFETDENAQQTRILHHWIESGHGMLLVNGPTGVGRTSLVHHAIGSSGLLVSRVVVSGLPLSTTEFLQHIVLELGLEVGSCERMSLQHTIRQFFKENVDTDRRFCLVVDNAESLDDEKRDFLQSLCNDHTLYLPLCLVVLIGDSGFGRSTLKARRSGAHQVVSQVLTVKPFKESSTRAYIDHRLSMVADEPLTIFPRTLVKLIHQQTGGYPAMINALCDTALLAAAADQKNQVTARHLSVAVTQLGWSVKFKIAAKPAAQVSQDVVTYRKKPQARQLKRGVKALEANTPSLHMAKRGTSKGWSSGVNPAAQNTDTLENSVHRLIQNVTTIGRAPDCGIRINEEDISPYQALVVKTSSGMVIRNEGGEVPIYLNSTKVQNANLREGDKVRIGNYELVVVADEKGAISMVSTPALA